jgi:hypothetical protein
VTSLRGRGRKPKDSGKEREPLREGKARIRSASSPRKPGDTGGGAKEARRGFATAAIHAGQPPDPATGAVIPPVYLTSTYARPSLDEPAPHGYARISHPTRAALETCVAVLEGGESGHAFASGMAAIEAVFALLRAGEHAVVSRTRTAACPPVRAPARRSRRARSQVDTSDLEAVEGAMHPGPGSSSSSRPRTRSCA